MAKLISDTRTEYDRLMTANFDGIKNYTATESVTRIDVSYAPKIGEDIDYITQKLTLELGRKLINHKYTTISTYRDPTELVPIHRVSINVVEGNHKFMNFSGDIFTVKGVRFTNDELVEMVQKHYPEKFI